MRVIPSILLILLFSLNACFEEDSRVPPYPGEVSTIPDSVQVYQSYFDLETGMVVKIHRSDSWQLGFESDPDGWHIITNSGAGWFIYNTNQDQLNQANEIPEDLYGLYDIQHAWPDSTAVGNWVMGGEFGNEYSQNVYLLGNYANGSFTSLKELVFLHVDETSYRFYYRERQTGSGDTVTIAKDELVNFVYYSFDLHQQVNLEPEKSSYDLIFGPYYDLATNFGQTIPYPVAGTLLNVSETMAVLDSLNSFDLIDTLTVQHLALSAQRDIPGYRWKYPIVNVSGGGSATYLIRNHYNYIIRTSDNNYFKLRFLSYMLDGCSGFPQFEYLQL